MKRDLIAEREEFLEYARSNEIFQSLFNKVLSEQGPTSRDYRAFLSLVVIFITSMDDYIKKLGFSMVVIYAAQTGDCQPLRDMAAFMGVPLPRGKKLEKWLISECVKAKDLLRQEVLADV